MDEYIYKIRPYGLPVKIEKARLHTLIIIDGYNGLYKAVGTRWGGFDTWVIVREINDTDDISVLAGTIAHYVTSERVTE